MKVPIENIYYLFCYAWDCLPAGRVVNVRSVPRPDSLNLFAHVIKTGAEHLLRRGLDRGYATEKEELRKIRGKVDFAASASDLASRRLRLVCDFDEFLPNVLHNQILRTTIKKLSLSTGIDRSLVNELSDLDRVLVGIDPIRLEASAFRRVQLHRNNAFYGFLLRVCELLRFACLPDRGEDGRFAFREVMDDESYMSAVFEKFIRGFYRIEQTEFPSVGSEFLVWDALSERGEDINFLPSMKTDVLHSEMWRLDATTPPRYSHSYCLVGAKNMKTKKEQLARATMRLPESLWNAVQHRAVDERITLSELVARALREYLKKGVRQ